MNCHVSITTLILSSYTPIRRHNSLSIKRSWSEEMQGSSTWLPLTCCCPWIMWRSFQEELWECHGYPYKLPLIKLANTDGCAQMLFRTCESVLLSSLLSSLETKNLLHTGHSSGLGWKSTKDASVLPTHTRASGALFIGIPNSTNANIHANVHIQRNLCPRANHLQSCLCLSFAW